MVLQSSPADVRMRIGPDDRTDPCVVCLATAP
jgi:hypothetical protein